MESIIALVEANLHGAVDSDLFTDAPRDHAGRVTNDHLDAIQWCLDFIRRSIPDVKHP